MAEGEKVSGRCLCGSVTFTLELEEKKVGVCHCGMCRKWAGSPWMVIDTQHKPVISGEENITYYKSSDYGERGFCSTCGSNLFWRMADQSMYVVAAGALDASDGFALAQEIFIDEKPDFYDFANDTKKLTGAEFIAKFLGG